MGSTHTGPWKERISPADWTALADALSEHMLDELCAMLAACDTDEVRSQILTEVIEAAPEFGDRAVIVALARVSHTNNDAGPSEATL
jgi:hypothetical protein